MDIPPEERYKRLKESFTSRYQCPHCQYIFAHTLAWEADEDIEPCPKCGKIIDFDEIDSLDAEFYYLAPLMRCRKCQLVFELPYSNLPQTDQGGTVLLRGEDPPKLPSEEWSAIFGCRACGIVTTYGTADVSIGPILKWIEGSYQSGKGVFYAEFPCGERRCTTPARMYVDIGDGSRGDLLQFLRSARLQGTCPSGHELRTVPEKLYNVEPVLRRMW